MDENQVIEAVCRHLQLSPGRYSAGNVRTERYVRRAYRAPIAPSHTTRRPGTAPTAIRAQVATQV